MEIVKQNQISKGIEPEKLAYIDLMRGIAIVMVLIVHTAQFSQPSTLITKYTTFGQLGVQLFFVASSFTLFKSYSQNTFNQNSLKIFYLKRYFRIAPLYYIGIIVYLAVNFFLFYIEKPNSFNDYTFEAVLSNLFLLHSFFPKFNNNIVPGGWSIATEVLFYLIFPYFYFLINRLSIKRIFVYLFIYLSMEIVVLKLIGVKYPINYDINSFYYYSIINQLPVFVCGTILYKLITQKESYSNLYLIPVFILSFLTVVILWLIKMDISFILISPFVGIAFSSLGLYLKKSEIELPVLQKIGQLSYSIYIFHFIIAWYLIAFVDSRVQYVIGNLYLRYGVYLVSTICISVVIAYFTQKFIEQPFIKVGKRITLKLR